MDTKIALTFLICQDILEKGKQMRATRESEKGEQMRATRDIIRKGGASKRSDIHQNERDRKW